MPDSPADYSLLSAVLASPVTTYGDVYNARDSSSHMNSVHGSSSNSDWRGGGVRAGDSGIAFSHPTPDYLMTINRRTERPTPSSREWYGSDSAHLRPSRNRNLTSFMPGNFPIGKEHDGVLVSSGAELNRLNTGDSAGSIANVFSTTSSSSQSATFLRMNSNDPANIGGLFGNLLEGTLASGSTSPHIRSRSASFGIISNPFSPHTNMQSLLLPSPTMSPVLTAEIEHATALSPNRPSTRGNMRRNANQMNAMRQNMGIAFGSKSFGDTATDLEGLDPFPVADQLHMTSLSSSHTYNDLVDQADFDDNFHSGNDALLIGTEAMSPSAMGQTSSRQSARLTPESNGSGGNGSGSGGHKRKYAVMAGNIASYGSSKRSTLRRVSPPNDNSPSSNDGVTGNRGKSKVRGKAASPNGRSGEGSFSTPGVAGVRQVSPENSKIPTEFLKVKCNCRKTKCIKLYCDCFRISKFCENCNCTDCSNTGEKEHERMSAITGILERNPEAFAPRIKEDPSSNAKGHLSGCHCKKSACLKKYCECYSAGVPCSDKCRCVECKNPPNGDGGSGESEDSRDGTETGVLAAGAGPVRQRPVTLTPDGHEGSPTYTNRYTQPHHQRAGVSTSIGGTGSALYQSQLHAMMTEQGHSQHTVTSNGVGEIMSPSGIIASATYSQEDMGFNLLGSPMSQHRGLMLEDDLGMLG